MALGRVLAIEEQLRIARATVHLDYLLELLESRDALGPEQRAELVPFALKLGDYWDRHSSWIPPTDALELSCLEPGQLRGRDPVQMLVKSTSGFRERWLEEATWPLKKMEMLLGNFGLLESDDPIAELRKLANTYPVRQWPDREERLEAYRDLSEEEAQELSIRAIDGVVSGDEPAVESLRLVAALFPFSISGVPTALAALSYFDAPELYRGADPEVTADVITRVISAGDERHLLLQVLAWIGDSAAVTFFNQARRRPPAWANGTPVHLYPFAGGWELDRSEGRRDLCMLNCVSLIPGGEGVTATTLESACDICGDQLHTLFDLALADPRLAFLPFAGSRLQVAFCARATCFGYDFYYSRMNADGSIAAANVRDRDDLPDNDDVWELPPGRLGLGMARSAFEGPIRHDLSCAAVSQIGGYPAWDQDALYPSCAACERSMLFVGHATLEELSGEPADGILHAFCCPECRTTAVGFQQT